MKEVLAILGCVSVSVFVICSVSTFREIHNDISERAAAERRAATWVSSAQMVGLDEVTTIDQVTEQVDAVAPPAVVSSQSTILKAAPTDVESVAGLPAMPEDKCPSNCAT